MNTLATDIRALISSRVATASGSELLAIAGALCANDPQIVPAAPRVPTYDRYAKLDAQGSIVGDDSKDWVAVQDFKTGLQWTRGSLGSMNWNDAKKAAGAVTLLGKSDWRLPTVEELLSMIDYKRVDPAVNPTFFDAEYGYTWSSTPAATDEDGDPSGYAWYVFLGNGYSYRGGRGSHDRVRAVRAGQQSALSF